ncbi:transposase, partial [Pelagicoccus sp. SDUM812003]|uniref:transposase n=1 Tax=Pelagicoccus sp. SDUM812003 TaxID=3041267 RepID=UPI00280E41EE
NRGNYRSWIFETDGAKASFEKSLLEAAERSGWKLHAYCVMGNHFHLALETPAPNLSEGMRWLQSSFAMRFNRFRKENGHIFQGRFKSIVVEDVERLAWLCHYIHLNPVRARICPVSDLRGYRYSSYFHLWDKRRRSKGVGFDVCLEGAGELKDTPAGRRKYQQYLAWLAEDEPRQKELLFDRMSNGWALGTKGFKQALLEDEKAIKACLELGVDDAREMRELAWEARLERCLGALGKVSGESGVESKSADWKVAIACYMKKTLLCRNGWLAERLNMGAESAVARYCSEFFRGGRTGALSHYRLLISKV